VPWWPGYADVIERARDLAARASADRTVTTEQLLLALLQAAPDLCRLLESEGMVSERLEFQVRALHEVSLRLDEPLYLEETTDELERARVLDAASNRAREALRVIEDYCRFVLDDALLCREMKELRHRLRQAVAGLSTGLFLESREALRDVGTTITTPSEQSRESLVEVVQANCKRLQEALRSLEEFGKLGNVDAAAVFEQIRYQAYTLERAILLGSAARQRLGDARLYLLVTGSLCEAALDWTIHEAAAGGVQILQLREKGMPDRTLVERARDVRRWTRQAGVIFIMNDRPDIARLVEADGVHLGQDDLPVKEARRILGPRGLIGVSTHDMDQVRQAVLDGASYLGVGPAFPSQTKDFTEFPGLNFVRQAGTATSLPAFAIGGINLDNIDEVTAAGLHRAAVSRAICRSDDPRQTAAALRRALDSR
jgi:thiamine-phosphate pyrophosphorylase